LKNIDVSKEPTQIEVGCCFDAFPNNCYYRAVDPPVTICHYDVIRNKPENDLT